MRKISNPKNAIQPWVDHLLEEIQNAKKPEEENSTPQDEIVSIKTLVENWNFMLNSPQMPLQKICNLDPVLFPEAGKLTIKQQQQLSEALINMFNTWNIDAAIPKRMPAHAKYTLAVGLLNKEAPILNDGFWVIDFCTGNSEGCELGKYCPCLKFNKRTIPMEKPTR